MQKTHYAIQWKRTGALLGGRLYETQEEAEERWRDRYYWQPGDKERFKIVKVTIESEDEGTITPKPEEITFFSRGFKYTPEKPIVLGDNDLSFVGLRKPIDQIVIFFAEED